MKLRRSYVRALKLLAHCAPLLSGSEANKIREKIIEVFKEGQEIIPGLKYSRAVNYFAVWIERQPVEEEDHE